MYDNLHISKGQMTWMAGVDAFMVNSIVFDVASADLTLSNSAFDSIFSNFSSPIVYIQNDPSSTDSY